MTKNSLGRLKDILSRFDRAKVLVVGDLMLDKFVRGKVSRISPEAPVPVVWVDSEDFMPGGASNVANNLSALGAFVYLAGVVGDDGRAQTLTSELRKKGVNCDGIVEEKGRVTTQKTRVIAHHQQVVRIDYEVQKPVSDHSIDSIVEFVRSHIKDIDAVILEDYGKGVIVPRLVREIVKIARKHKKIITVDPKETHFSYYRGVTTLTPNHHEAAHAVGFKIKDDETLIKAGKKMLQKLKCETVLITLGENGMAVFQEGRKMVKIPTIAQEVFDVSGAGDTVISAYTLARASGANAIEAAHISNCAAGIVVGKVGVAVTNRRELGERIRKELRNGKVD